MSICKYNEITNIETKTALIKSVTLVAGAAILMHSFSGNINEIMQTNNSMAESYEKITSIQASTSSFAEENNTADVENNFSADNAIAKTLPDKSKNTSPEKSNSIIKVPSTKEEIVDYFNTVINKVKPNAKEIILTDETCYQASSIDLSSLGALEPVVNDLIASNTGKNEEKCGLTATTLADKNKIFPVENEVWASKLTANDVKEAQCTEKDGIFTIKLKIADDELSETTNHGECHNGKVISIVEIKTVYDNAGAASSLLKGLKIGYTNGSVIIKADAKTGNVLSAVYDFTWILHIDMLGGINVPFGITQEFKIKW